jgi:hypothetical protein
MAVFVAVFIFKTNLYLSPGPIVTAITSLIIIAAHALPATYRTTIPVLVVRHSPPVVGWRAVDILCSPTAADLDVISALPILLARLVRLLRVALWLDRNTQGLVRTRSFTSHFRKTRS